MSPSSTPFHTAAFEHHVPGPKAEMAAVSYNLQYTKPLVTDYVQANPPTEIDTQVIRLRDHQLTRVNLYGAHPEDSQRRVCVIGLGDDEQRASKAAQSAWFDYHASVLFTSKLADDDAHLVAIRRRIPGVAPQRAETVGVAYDVDFMRPLAEAAVARNIPTLDECHVVQAGEMTLMRVNLYGRHPFDETREVCVGGIADRHYRAMAAAEQAWAKFHTSLLLAADGLGQ
jgi:hypothetical protein